MKKLIAVTTSVLMALAFADAPRLLNVTAKQRYPWNGKVDISFEVAGDLTGNAFDWNSPVLSLTATNRADGARYAASADAVSGDTEMAAGVHHVVWDLDAQGLAFKSDEVVFSVTYTKPCPLYCVIDLSAGKDADSYPVAVMDEPPDGGFNTREYKTTKLALRLIEPGSFKMGGSTDVTLTKPYYMGVFEVTQKQYELVTGEDPSYYKGEMRPVEQVSYYTARGSNDWPTVRTVAPDSFAGRLQARTGLCFDLPTEAQWEYACRAGTTSSYNNGGSSENDLRLVGRYEGNQSDVIDGYTNAHVTVGSYQPNAWSLYDMHGNVRECCLDRYANRLPGGTDPEGPATGSVNRPVRGGSFDAILSVCDSSTRRFCSPSLNYVNQGIRLAIRLDAEMAAGVGQTGVVCVAETAAVAIDSRSGVRESDGAETLVYSSRWDGDAAATVTIAEDGAALAEGLSGAGEFLWNATRGGTCVLTHTTYTNGVAAKVETATFNVGSAGGTKPARPVFSPASGTLFDAALSVSISCATAGATIHYTTDGSEPTAASAVYSPFSISGKTTVKAVAEKGGELSEIAVAEYALGRCDAPGVDAAASFTGSKTRVAISCATEGAVVRYTLNGTEPNSHSTRYKGPFYVTNSCTVKAYATKADYFASAVTTQAIEKAWVIGDTMGKPDHGFTTDGSNGLGWSRVADVTAPGGEAMKSGAISHDQSSVLATTVTGPGVLSFVWRTSCEEDPDGCHEWDHVELAVDGAEVRWLDGETAWQAESVAIAGDGEHVVEWRYEKDDIESAGEDAAWVAAYSWESAYTATRTTDVPVPYAWLGAHDPDVVDEYEAYEASAKAPAANGRTVWECYVLGLDPQVATNDFRITSFPMAADGTPDLAHIEFHPPQAQWNVPATYKVKGTPTLGGPWADVPAGGNPAHRFFKVQLVLP